MADHRRQLRQQDSTLDIPLTSVTDDYLQELGRERRTAALVLAETALRWLIPVVQTERERKAFEEADGAAALDAKAWNQEPFKVLVVACRHAAAGGAAAAAGIAPEATQVAAAAEAAGGVEGGGNLSVGTTDTQSGAVEGSGSGQATGSGHKADPGSGSMTASRSTSPEVLVAGSSGDTPDLLKECLSCRGQTGLKRCSGCMRARFCSSQCQRAAWPSHKADCKRWAAEAAKAGAADSPRVDS